MKFFSDMTPLFDFIEKCREPEFKVVERVKYDGKVWMALLIGDKEEKKAEKDERCSDHD